MFHELNIEKTITKQFPTTVFQEKKKNNKELGTITCKQRDLASESDVYNRTLKASVVTHSKRNVLKKDVLLFEEKQSTLGWRRSLFFGTSSVHHSSLETRRC